MPAEQSANTEKNDSSDEVEIKEEPPEVVEISSEDEKPKIEDLNGTNNYNFKIVIIFSNFSDSYNCMF